MQGKNLQFKFGNMRFMGKIKTGIFIIYLFTMPKERMLKTVSSTAKDQFISPKSFLEKYTEST